MLAKTSLRAAAIVSLVLSASKITAATDAALVDLLVQNGALTSAQAATLETGNDASVDPAFLDLLVQNGVLTADQAAPFRSGQTVIASAPVPHATPGASPSASSTTIESTPRTGLVRAKDKAVETLTISGRVHAQMDYLSTSYDQATDPDEEFNLFLRRLYLGASAQFADDLAGTINANFANDAAGVAEIEKALIAIGLSDRHTLELGYQKTPFSYEETTSAAKIWAVERSVATRYFTEQLDYGARHSGLFLKGETGAGWGYELALTKPEQGGVASSAASDAVAFWGRTEWTGKIGASKVTAGVNGGLIPELRGAGLRDLVYGTYLRAQFDALQLEAELLAGTLENAAGGEDAHPLGWNLASNWRISEAFDLVARVSWLETDGGIGADISTTARRAPESGSALYDSVESYYFGGNWYLRGQTLKLTAGYEWSLFSDNLTGLQGDARTEGLRTRLQLLF